MGIRAKKSAQTSGRKSESLMVRLDAASKRVVRRAAALRRVSASDYVRTLVVSQARREVDAPPYAWVLSPAEQLAFWEALHAPPRVSPELKRLAELMRGT